MVYIIYNVSNSLYQKELSDLLEYSIIMSGQEGAVIQLQNNDLDTDFEFESNIGVTYKLEGIKSSREKLRFNHLTANDWLSSSHLLKHHTFNDDDLLFFVDPDMIFKNKVDLLGRIGPGEIWGQKWITFTPGNHYGFDVTSDTVMYPYLIRADDYRKMIDVLENVGTYLYNNVDGWMLDMYVYAITFQILNFKLKLEDRLCLCNSWSIRDQGSPMLHYMMPIKKKSIEIWYKAKNLVNFKYVNPNSCDNEFDKETLNYINDYKLKTLTIEAVNWLIGDPISWQEMRVSRCEYFYKSCEKNNITPYTVGYGLPYKNFYQKSIVLLEYLKNKCTSDIVVCTDSFDIIYLEDLQKIKEKFLKYNTRILISGEKWFMYQHEYSKPNFDKIESPYRYVNAGCYMGYRTSLIEMLEEQAIYESQKGYGNDQGVIGAWVHGNLDNPELVQLDTTSSIFWTVTDDWAVAINVLKNTKTVFNPHTGNYPSILHVTGLNDKGKKLHKLASNI